MNQQPFANKIVFVSKLPNCNFCKEEGSILPARFDGRTKRDIWANMCEFHFKRHGVGLGLGKGQILIA